MKNNTIQSTTDKTLEAGKYGEIIIKYSMVNQCGWTSMRERGRGSAMSQVDIWDISEWDKAISKSLGNYNKEAKEKISGIKFKIEQAKHHLKKADELVDSNSLHVVQYEIDSAIYALNSCRAFLLKMIGILYGNGIIENINNLKRLPRTPEGHSIRQFFDLDCTEQINYYCNTNKHEKVFYPYTMIYFGDNDGPNVKINFPKILKRRKREEQRNPIMSFRATDVSEISVICNKFIDELNETGNTLMNL